MNSSACYLENIRIIIDREEFGWNPYDLYFFKYIADAYHFYVVVSTSPLNFPIARSMILGRTTRPMSNMNDMKDFFIAWNTTTWKRDIRCLGHMLWNTRMNALSLPCVFPAVKILEIELFRMDIPPKSTPSLEDKVFSISERSE